MFYLDKRGKIHEAIQLPNGKYKMGTKKVSQDHPFLLKERPEKIVKIGKTWLPTKADDLASNYHFPKWVDSILLDIKLDQNVLLTGHSGAGKTSIVLEIAKLLGIQCHRIQLSSSATQESLIGGYVPSETGAKWADGLVTKAVKEGHWIILDEYDMCPTSIRTVLQGLLEVDNRTLSLNDKDGGEIIYKKDFHPQFRIFATGNTFGLQMDSGSIYGGASEHNQAQLSRWNVYSVELPTGDLLYKILRKKTNLRKKILKSIVDVAESVNKLGIVGVVFSPRVCLAIATKMQFGLSFMEAVYPTLLNHYREEDTQDILRAISDVSNFIAEQNLKKKGKRK